MKKTTPRHKRDAVLVAFFIILSVMVLLLPTGFEKSAEERSVRCRGKILSVDNSDIRQMGIVKTGNQEVKLEILNGRFKGRFVRGNNMLMGHMDRDKIYAVGDTALVMLSLDQNGNITFVNPQDHYRLELELVLLGSFSLLLILFGGWTGAKALLSFIFAALVLWKVLVPLLLQGYHPIFLSLIIVTILTASIIFLVAGINRKGMVAFSGAFLGILTSCLLATFFTRKFHVHGAVMPFAETLLYSGYGHLNLAQIYIAAIFIAASGAVMDLSMDVAASMDEIVSRNKDITTLEVIGSGFTVGRAVVGTMTTTLLFAYSGGFITLLMAFMAQGVPIANLFNFIYVATEVLKILVGSFGLVTVAPFTAIMGGLILVKTNRVKNR